MKINRRRFLRLSVGFSLGAGAGVALSPLPWKFVDDSSIWTQTWPWVPNPERGDVTHIHSVCTLCPGRCGITVRKVGDRAIKIEGREGYPVNNGGICPLGASGLQLLYGPWRIPGPLMRIGPRGSGRWKQITWQRALNDVAQKLAHLRAEDKAHTVVGMVNSERGTVNQLLARFLKAYGSPNFFQMTSSEDTQRIALKLMTGSQGGIGYDLEGANFILSFGSGLLEGWGSPVRVIQAHSKWRSGPTQERVQVVQIEPRLSNTAAKADQWLPINPGTEAALALGLANVIIRESMYSVRFIEEYSFGFEDWTDSDGTRHQGFKSLVQSEYSPEKVEAITGIAADDIVKLARKFSMSERPLAVWGRGKAMTPGSLYDCMAVDALNALMGNLNKPGGISIRPEVETASWPDVELDDKAKASLLNPRIDGAGSDKYPLTQYLPHKLPTILSSDRQDDIQALLVHEADPYYTMANNEQAVRALDSIPFVVSFSTYMDETANRADLILPNHHYLERWEDAPTPIGLSKPVLGILRPVVEPQLDTMHTADALIRLGKVLGGSVAKSFDFKSYESLLKETLKKEWSQLKETGYVADLEYRPPLWDETFKPPLISSTTIVEPQNPEGTGRPREMEVADALENNGDKGQSRRDPEQYKFKFCITSPKVTIENRKDVELLPHYEPLPAYGDEEVFPLVLIPVDLMRLSSGPVGNPPFCTKILEATELEGNDVFVDINPVTARTLGIADEAYANLETPTGKAQVRVHYSEGIIPGTVAIPKGLGHKAYDDYLSDKGVNANELIGVVEDPITGLSANWGIRARLISDNGLTQHQNRAKA